MLAARYPTAQRFGDIQEVQTADLAQVELICGGFPCTDISSAGDRAGLDGEHSGLWTEFARIVRDLRPRYVLVENVPALLVRGMGTVISDPAASGYDAGMGLLSGCGLRLPQLRAREWILAYPCGERSEADDTIFAGRPIPELRTRWLPEPEVGRVADGLPGGMDRVQWLGDALIPQIAEYIGARILEAA